MKCTPKSRYFIRFYRNSGSLDAQISEGDHRIPTVQQSPSVGLKTAKLSKEIFNTFSC